MAFLNHCQLCLIAVRQPPNTNSLFSILLSKSDKSIACDSKISTTTRHSRLLNEIEDYKFNRTNLSHKQIQCIITPLIHCIEHIIRAEKSNNLILNSICNTVDFFKYFLNEYKLFVNLPKDNLNPYINNFNTFVKENFKSNKKKITLDVATTEIGEKFRLIFTPLLDGYINDILKSVCENLLSTCDSNSLQFRNGILNESYSGLEETLMGKNLMEIEKIYMEDAKTYTTTTTNTNIDSNKLITFDTKKAFDLLEHLTQSKFPNPYETYDAKKLYIITLITLKPYMKKAIEIFHTDILSFIKDCFWIIGCFQFHYLDGLLMAQLLVEKEVEIDKFIWFDVGVDNWKVLEKVTKNESTLKCLRAYMKNGKIFESKNWISK